MAMGVSMGFLYLFFSVGVLWFSVLSLINGACIFDTQVYGEASSGVTVVSYQ